MPKLGKDLLPDTSVKTAKPKDKPYSLRDGAGLWLVVEPTGPRHNPAPSVGVHQALES